MNIKKLQSLEEIARALAKDNPREHKHISFAISKNRVLGIGTNWGKTAPITKELRYWGLIPHSEIDALKGLENISKLTLVNFRFNNHGKLRMSRPCRRCFPLMFNLCKDIYWSTDDGIVKLNKRTMSEDLIYDTKFIE